MQIGQGVSELWSDKQTPPPSSPIVGLPVVVIFAVDWEDCHTRQDAEIKKTTFRSMINEKGATKYIRRALLEENQQRPI